MIEPRPEDEVYKDPGTVSTGCMMGCSILGVILIGGFLLAVDPSSGGNARETLSLKFRAVGLATHWIVLVPLIRKASSKGEVNVRLGLIISACIGALLGTTCGGILLFS